MSDKEIWHIIYYDNEPTHYSVSSLGQIRNNKTMNILSQSKDQNNYHYITLNIFGKRKMFRVHRLVCDAFYPVRLTCQDEVNHEDGDVENNNVDNLTWCTRQENMDHANKNNLITRHKGESHHKASHTDDEIMRIIQLMRDGLTNKEICKKLNMIHDSKTRTFLSHIRRGKGWTHITSQFDDIPESPSRSIYDKELIISICELLEQGLSKDKIIKKLNLDRNDPKIKALITGIYGRRRFTLISKEYKW